MNLSEIARLLKVTCPDGCDTVEFNGASIDSRQVSPGNLFVAIPGERVDGHNFAQNAIYQGAVAVLSERWIPNLSVPQLQVQNTVQALADIATYYRKQQPCAVIALTGSNGKTTVKEMIAAILPPSALATKGNLNNHIGVPLTVMRLQPEHRYAVFELGANHLGEIAHTVAIAQPHVTLINNIAPAHIEGFGSLEGVARAKGEIHQGLSVDGTAIINADDAFSHFWDPWLIDKKIIRFSLQETADIYARDIVFDEQGCARFMLFTPLGQTQIKLLVPGQHNVSNALAAAACTFALGIGLAEIVKGLCQFTGVSGRMTFRQGKNSALIIDDTYNANLRSVLTALAELSKRPGQRIFVFGDMGELGAWSQAHHQEVGEMAREYGIEILMTYGQYSEITARAFGTTAKHYHSQDKLAEDLIGYLDEKTTVLVKGSRAAAMENVVQKVVV